LRFHLTTPRTKITDAIKEEHWRNQPAEDVLEKPDTTAAGISVQEAEKRVAAPCSNEFKEGKRVALARFC
jgi:hypothetical protein